MRQNLEKHQQKLLSTAALLAAKLGAPEYAKHLGADEKRISKITAPLDYGSTIRLLGEVAQLYWQQSCLVYYVAEKKTGKSLDYILPDLGKYMNSVYLEGFGGGLKTPGERLENVASSFRLQHGKLFGECINKLQARGMTVEFDKDIFFTKLHNTETWRLALNDIRYDAALTKEYLGIVDVYTALLWKSEAILDLLPVAGDHAFIETLYSIKTRLESD